MDKLLMTEGKTTKDELLNYLDSIEGFDNVPMTNKVKGSTEVLVLLDYSNWFVFVDDKLFYYNKQCYIATQFLRGY